LALYAPIAALIEYDLSISLAALTANQSLTWINAQNKWWLIFIQA